MPSLVSLAVASVGAHPSVSRYLFLDTELLKLIAQPFASRQHQSTRGVLEVVKNPFKPKGLYRRGSILSHWDLPGSPPGFGRRPSSGLFYGGCAIRRFFGAGSGPGRERTRAGSGTFGERPCRAPVHHERPLHCHRSASSLRTLTHRGRQIAQHVGVCGIFGQLRPSSPLRQSLNGWRLHGGPAGIILIYRIPFRTGIEQ